MRVLGISAYYHDSAAALLRDGQVLAAAQEERFTRKKHDDSFPHNAIQSCLVSTGTRPEDIDVVAFYDKPFLKFERLLETYLAFAPKGFTSFRKALPLWVKDKLFQRTTILKELKQLRDEDWEPKLIFSEHHLSHAASAFYPSPFERAAVLTMDGVGEWTTTSLAIGNGRELNVTHEIHFPHSIGLLYSAFTYYTGFKVNSGEYKVMGLAPYGDPRFVDVIKKNLVDIKEDGTFRLNMEYFDYCTGLTMTNEKFDQLFGGPPRKPEQANGCQGLCPVGNQRGRFADVGAGNPRNPRGAAPHDHPHRHKYEPGPRRPPGAHHPHDRGPRRGAGADRGEARRRDGGRLPSLHPRSHRPPPGR
jgi:carbamoyltransferase